MPNSPDMKLPWFLPLGLLTAVFVTACIASDAEAADAGLSGIEVGELGRVQSETILLNAKAEQTKAKRLIESGTNSDQAVSYPTQIPIGTPAQTSTPTTSDLRHQDLPVVKAITGSTNKLRAALLYRSGIEVEVTAGARDLPGNFRVAQISLESVILEGSGGKRFLLGFSERAPGVSQTSTPTSPAMPGLAPGSY